MRLFRRLWHRVRGWWLLTAAAIVTAALSTVGKLYPGAAVAIAVAVGGAVAGVVSERGRAQLSARTAPAGLRVVRVDRLTDPIRLGVHRAAALNGDRVPPFVARDRLPELVDALRAGGFVLVVGDSTAGKTRLAFEAMKTCLPRHRCVVPDGAVGAAVTAAVENRPSVLWLDDLDRYLGVGGLSLPDLHHVAAKGVVVLATIRTHERERLSERHDAGRDHTGRLLARAGREILDAVTTEVRLSRGWSPREREAAEDFADDPRIAAALANADRHGVAEHLAAGPELVRDLRDAWDSAATARGAALVTAAVDLRRAGYDRPVPVGLLRTVHESYLRDGGRAESWDDAVEWATRPLHATSSLLEPMGDDEYLAFDYLLEAAVQDEETPPVPDAVWHAVADFAEPAALVEVAWEAAFVGNVDYLRRAITGALERAEYVAAAAVANMLGDLGREDEAVACFEQILAVAEDVLSPQELLSIRSSLAWQVGEKLSGRGDPRRALAISRDLVEDSVAVLGVTHPLTLAAKKVLARQVGAAGQPEEALSLARSVVDEATRALGPADPVTLSARFELAVWTRETQGHTAGVDAFGELLDAVYAVDGVSAALVADVQWNLGGALNDAGRPDAAVEMLEAAMVNKKRLYGPNHVLTLEVRLRHLDALSDTGDLARSITLADELARDGERVVGADHLVVLTARAAAAVCLAESGDHAAAVTRFEALLDDLPHLPEDHWLTAEVRTGYERLRRP